MNDEDLDDDEFDDFDDDEPCAACTLSFDTVEVYDDFYLCIECLLNRYRVLDWDNKQMRRTIEQLESD